MRKFFAKTAGLWRTLAIVFALVFAVFFVVGGLLETNSAQVNRYLGTSTSVILAGEGETTYDKYVPDYDTSGDLKNEHIKVGTQVGAEGSVLLQNDIDSDGVAALPLSTSEKITLFGIASTGAGGYFGMDMGGTVEASQNVTLYEALIDRGASVNSAMNDYYENAVPSGDSGYNYVSTFFTLNDAVPEVYKPYEATTDTSTAMMGEYTDVGIVVIGRPSTEGGDYNPGSLGLDEAETTARTSLALTGDELSMIDAAKNACDKVVVLINACNPMELGPIMTGEDHAVDAILWIGFPGNYGYLGIADVLLGNSNPSGRLTDTYAYDSTSAPAMQNFGVYKYTNWSDVGWDHYGWYYVVESESIYTGYKYYETRYEDAVLGDTAASSTAGAFDSEEGWTYGEEVAYSFGEGLSYTEFEQKIGDKDGQNGFVLSEDKKTATVTVTVTNKGNTPGRSVVQVYGQSPYTSYDKTNGVEKASVQLLNYGKTEEIPAGGSTTISIPVEMQYLASYDSSYDNSDGTYGTYIMEQTGEGTTNSSQHYYIALGCNNQTGSSAEDAYQEGAHAAVNNILTKKEKSKSDGGNVMDSTGSSDAVYEFDWEADDEYIFSTSNAGVEISNQLDSADLNTWGSDTTVTYLSRSDWEWKDSNGTSLWNTGAWSESNMKGYSGVTASSDMLVYLDGVTHEIPTSGDVSGVLFDQTEDDDPKYNLTFADMINADGSVLAYDDEKWYLLMDELNLEEAIEFVALGNREYSNLTTINFLGGSYVENGPTGPQLTIPASYEAPWFVIKDENNSYAWNDLGAEPLQAATFDHDLLKEIGEMWGNDSLYVNMPLLWAPSLNLHRTPYNGRTAEYYSEDAILTGYCASEVVNGAEKKGLMATIKHYAANDQEGNRYGISAYMSEQQLRENELRGFQIAFEGGAKAVMTSYNRIGPVYSGANEGLMMGILRGEWDYQGYAISDYVPFSENYMTFTESVLCGTSTFDKNQYFEDGMTASSLAKKYAYDAEMLEAIKEAAHHTLWTFANSNMANYMTANATRVWVANWWRVSYITLEVVGGVVACASVVLYVISRVVGKKDDDDEEA